jgi:hypothetical protein
LFEQRLAVNRREHHRAKVRWLAYHEAAHAVVAASFGKTVECLTLDTYDYAGGCRWRPDHEIWPALVTVAAGTAAERFGGRIRETEWAGGTDFEVLSDLVRGDRVLMASAEREALRRVERFWPTIEAIAIQLQELGALQGGALTRALLPARPPPAPSPATRSRAITPGRSISVFKPVRTITDKNGIALAELWDCRTGDGRWFEAYIFQTDGSKKKLGRFSDQNAATRAIIAAVGHGKVAA